MRSEAPAPNGLVGMIFFLGAEAMLFAGLASAFLILRVNAPQSAAGEPWVPARIMALNTFVLLASGLTMLRAQAAARADRHAAFRRRLLATALLGSLFLAVQGAEWVHFGPAFTSGLYGPAFCTLVGVHGLHVAAGVVGLLFVLARASGELAGARGAATVCGLYWSFVVAVWVILYALLYLA